MGPEFREVRDWSRESQERDTCRHLSLITRENCRCVVETMRIQNLILILMISSQCVYKLIPDLISIELNNNNRIEMNEILLDTIYSKSKI